MTEVWSGGGPEQPWWRRSGVLAGIAGAAVVLAMVGATGGWLLGSAASSAASGDRTPSPTATSGGDAAASRPRSNPTSSAPTSGGKARSASPTSAGNGIVLPDVSDKDFVAARSKLLGLNLGVQVVFSSAGEDRTVAYTQPQAGSRVSRGHTVKIFVRGTAPAVTVPSLIGRTCSSARAAAVDSGLSPRYASGETGTVVDQDPRPTDTARWNDTIKLACERAGSTSSP